MWGAGVKNVTAVINTCCMGPNNAAIGSSGGGAPYSERARLLRDLIIPRYLEWDVPVIIVGEYLPDIADVYRYLPMPSHHFGVEDALEQRAVASELVETDYAIFQHDDHLPSINFPEAWAAQIKGANIYSPARWQIGINGVERLNNGELDETAGIINDPPYVSGHFCVMDRTALDQQLWAKTPRVFTWDVEFTKLARKYLTIQWTRHLTVWDVE